jgi:outer membrane protein OmpA-like peptidoglycan-associated protein
MVLNYAHKQTDREYDKQFLVTVLSTDTNQTIFQSIFVDELPKHRTIYPDTVSRREWLGARAVGVGAGTNSLERIRNRTIMALGKRVYQQLKRDGRADEVATYVIMSDINQIYRVQGSLELVATETLTVVLDGAPRQVRALHTKGTFFRASPMLQVPAENWYVDDPDFAWVIRIEQKINGKDYHVRLGTVDTSPSDQGKQLDAALSGSSCRAQTYGIYFAYNSAEVTPESDPTLAQVAGVLKQHADWSLTIEGHTDSIGGVKYNQELSARRAAAVKQRLVDRYGIAGSRLSSAGVGLGRPLAPNGTLEGRARNRRVELVRC